MVERLSVPSTDHISFQHRVGARWQQQLGSPQACTVAAPLVRSHDIPTNAKESKEFNDITCRYTFVHTAQLTLAKRRLPQTSRYFRTTIGSFQSQSQLPTLPFAIQSPMIPRIPAPCLFGNIALKLLMYPCCMAHTDPHLTGCPEFLCFAVRFRLRTRTM